MGNSAGRQHSLLQSDGCPAALLLSAIAALLAFLPGPAAAQSTQSGLTASHGRPPPPAEPVAVMPSGRITNPPPEQLTPAARKYYDDSVRGYGGPLGPRMPLLQSPEVLLAWEDLAQALRKSALPAKLQQIAILTVAATWTSEFAWYVHDAGARRDGVSPDVVGAIKRGDVPKFASEDERIVYNYAMELQRTHFVSDETYQAARTLLGDRTLVDLTVLLGRYVTVAMILNAHKAPLPNGVQHQF